jgi:integrating conjugative element relaxase (TIGR03760 family)
MQLGRGLRCGISRLAARLRQADSAGPAARPAASEVAPAAVPLHGSEAGWLRVLTAGELLQAVQADMALREIHRRTRLAPLVWERDCLSAIRRYAEFVQLLPASEAHHHAHAGGLLAHTIEMLLAALTWRGGRLLPEGAPIEIIDAQRDEWTMVVFYCALLHDIAKPMSDLKVSWRTAEMADAIRWQPMSGSLLAAAGQRASAEYLVEFTPKALRDYRAHSRMAMLLLHHIASPAALSFLARQPAAFEALNRYLSGEDRDSLLAQIVREADKASTRRALQSGNRARFATASAVPLVDLLMQGMRELLRAGTELPLNRSGAAAWVYDDSIWFVAKRLADATRGWIKAHAPDETVPGEAKNDRLFDAWQEYGCLTPNPGTGQAIWYVTVRGQGGDAAPAASGSEAGAKESARYEHSLSMLRFPLEKVFADPAHYPQVMQGRIEVLAKRGVGDAAAGASADDAAAGARLAAVEAEPARRLGSTLRQGQAVDGAAADGQPLVATGHAREAAAGAVDGPTASSGKPSARRNAEIKAPSFNKPKPKAATVAGGKDRPEAAAKPPTAAARPPLVPERSEVTAASWEHEDAAKVRRPVFEPLEHEADDLLDPAEAAPTSAREDRELDDRALASRSLVGRGMAPATSARAGELDRPAALAERDFRPVTAPSAPNLLQPAGTFLRPPRFSREGVSELPAGPAASEAASEPGPSAVLLPPNLPPVRGDQAKGSKTAPAPLALEFMRWVQTALVDRSIKHNEAGAVVHFVAEGMALVSPRIFKLFAQRRVTSEDEVSDFAMQVQRDLIRAGWHLAGPNRTNIIKFSVLGRGGAAVGRLAAVVLIDPGRWVQPVPPSNPVLRVE